MKNTIVLTLIVCAFFIMPFINVSPLATLIISIMLAASFGIIDYVE